MPSPPGRPAKSPAKPVVKPPRRSRKSASQTHSLTAAVVSLIVAAGAYYYLSLESPKPARVQQQQQRRSTKMPAAAPGPDTDAASFLSLLQGEDKPKGSLDELVDYSFMALDHDHDDVIGPAELEMGAKVFKSPALLAAMDLNGDGRIPRAEADEWWEKRRAARERAAKAAAEAKAAKAADLAANGASQGEMLFMQLDSDEDNSLSVAEIGAMLDAMQGPGKGGSAIIDRRPPMSADAKQRAAREMYARIDADGDGEVTPAELDKWAAGIVRTAKGNAKGTAGRDASDDSSDEETQPGAAATRRAAHASFHPRGGDEERPASRRSIPSDIYAK